MMERVGHCGDGYEWTEMRHGRKVIACTFDGSRFCNRTLYWLWSRSYGRQLWLMCTNKEALKKAGAKALDAIHDVEGVVSTFDVCLCRFKT